MSDKQEDGIHALNQDFTRFDQVRNIARTPISYLIPNLIQVIKGNSTINKIGNCVDRFGEICGLGARIIRKREPQPQVFLINTSRYHKRSR